ncbi:hypothetical protein BDZ45DRAFT_800390 [Acephala macrosclerotiorum]|nr:hypothetical protein BDZ45DRAFT_800390 [Acephala macrosclerotiorum]
MQFDSPNITVSLVFAFAVSVTMALPLPITLNASNFRDAVESVAKVYADQVEKEYGIVPNMLGDGKAVGLLNVQVGSNSANGYLGGKEISLGAKGIQHIS